MDRQRPNGDLVISLPAAAPSARRAREELEPLRERMDPTSFLKLQLVVTELVAQSLSGDPPRGSDGDGSGGRCRMRLSAPESARRIRVDVAGGAIASALLVPRPQPGDPGWGIHIARRLATQWGMERAPDGARAWLELRVEGDGAGLS